MKILHIITQKPHSTGSGVYMCGMINGFEKIGYTQAVIAGIDKDDKLDFFEGDIAYYPVVYNTNELPFNIVGMSDVMPYQSTRYKDMNKNMVDKLQNAFEKSIKKAISEFKPDLIISHHLYLLTASIREIVKDIPLVSICHGTCLRQIQSHDLEKDYILSNIKKLDAVFALHDEQQKEIINIFNIDESKVFTLGSGYDENMFFNDEEKLDNRSITITYAGKICKAKGVNSLINSLDKLNYNKDFINVNIAGYGNDKQEYEEIIKLAEVSKFKINFSGKINQENLSELFRNSHIFVLPSFFEGLPLVVIESLASGCNIVTTDTPGVKDWIGESINKSEKINYIDLPNMKNIGVPFEKEIPGFEDKLAYSLNDMIESMLSRDTRNKKVDMKDKTWKGLCNRLEKFVKFDDMEI